MRESESEAVREDVDHVLDVLRERFAVDALPLDGTPLASVYPRVRVELTDEEGHRVLLLGVTTNAVLGEASSSGELAPRSVLSDGLLRARRSLRAASPRPLATNDDLRRLDAALASVPWIVRARAADLLRPPVLEWGASELLLPDPTRPWPRRRVVLLEPGGALALATAVARDLATGVPPEWATRRAPFPEPSW